MVEGRKEGTIHLAMYRDITKGKEKRMTVLEIVRLHPAGHQRAEFEVEYSRKVAL